jgi:hypothetical protein
MHTLLLILRFHEVAIKEIGAGVEITVEIEEVIGTSMTFILLLLL